MDAHANEAAAAVAAMERPLVIGDRVRGYVAGRWFRGVLEAIDRDQVDVDCHGVTVTCRRCDIERDEQDGPTSET